MSAKEMFEELGYKLIIQTDYVICYQNKRKSHIYFENHNKIIDLASQETKNKKLTLKQLQAINKQIEELHWNE